MEKLVPLAILLCTSLLGNSQEENKLLRKGTVQYKKEAFDRSLPPFKKAVEINPENPVSQYNLGNAFFRNKNYPESAKAFDNAIVNTEDIAFKEQAFYNKGVALTKQKKLRESILAYKSALRLDPTDEDARHNLQKALHELQQESKPNENQPKDENQQQEKSKQQEKPKEQQSKLNKRQVENLLKALQQKEQGVQKKVQQAKSRSTSQQEKDW